MNRKSSSISVFSVFALFFAHIASAQSPRPVAVSDTIEGGRGGVSAARCGNSIVVAFGDMEPGNPASNAGFAYSKNGGRTFTDGGTLAVDPRSGADQLGAPEGPIDFPNNQTNPAVACSNANTFYYASAGSINATCEGCFVEIPNSSIAVSTSTDGGAHWGLPVAIENQLNDTEQFLAPSIAVDPTDPSSVWVAFLHFSINPSPFFFPPGFCDPNGYFIRWEHSITAGQYWFGAGLTDYSCGQPDSDLEHTGTLGAPAIAVSPTGDIYIAYEFMGQDSSTGQPSHNEIRVTRSNDGGNTFSAPAVISTDVANNSSVRIAVDSGTSAHRGAVYVTWSGSPTGTYTDVLVSDSLDHGASFSFPRSISAAPVGGAERFQTDPVIAVDSDGELAACFYETASNAPTSSSVYAYNCATSFNNSATWQTRQIVASAPLGYGAISADFSGHYDNFFTPLEVMTSGTRRVVSQAIAVH